jgi:alkanesulfonate monooxygenase SsuD/methylene tetrahydromethanopterin reductase-like flavin-dependent oxidoreductase (luciferase family)
MTQRPDPLHLGVALDGAGWHPAAWRTDDAQPKDLFTAGYWLDLVRTAERGLIDFVTIEDSLGLQTTKLRQLDGRTDQVRGRLDAVLISARVAPLTERIGLLPTVVATYTEPFHASKAIATLDYVSNGRAGVRIQVTARPNVAKHFGHRSFPPPPGAGFGEPPSLTDDLFGEGADYIEVVRRLWDSWEDDAEIRDAATGRFVDRAKLHYINFKGPHFSVRGPSITPRPPQGQPIVSALGHNRDSYRLIARSSDLGFVTPGDADQARSIVSWIRDAQAAADRAEEIVHVFGDVLVFLDDDELTASKRKAKLDALAGEVLRSDALIFVGNASQLADLLLEWQAAGLTGFRLRPGAIPHDLDRITDQLVPELQKRGAFRTAYDEGSLRSRLGFDRPISRYATAGAQGGGR